MNTPDPVREAARTLLATLDDLCGRDPVWKMEMDDLRAALASDGDSRPTGAVGAVPMAWAIVKDGKVRTFAESEARAKNYQMAHSKAWAGDIVPLYASVPPEPADPQPNAPLLPELFGGMKHVPCAVQFDPNNPQFGWLFIPHADGKWVSLCKLPAFSKSVIEYWLAEPNAGG